MDTKISLGDLAISGNGLLSQVHGIDEYLQRAYIALTVKRGSFIYDKNFGSYELDEGSEKSLIALGNQGLINLDCEIISVEIYDDIYTFTVKTPYGVGEVDVKKGGD